MAENPTIQDLLKTTGASSPAQSGVSTQQKALEQFEEKIHDVRLKELEEETKKQADAQNLGYVNLKGFPISPEAIAQIPEAQASELGVLCFLYTGPEIRLAARDPQSKPVKELLYQLEERLSANGGLYKISEESLRLGLETYKRLPKIKPIIKGVKITEEELEKFSKDIRSYTDVQASLAKANVTDIVTVILSAAYQLGSSDVHIEAEKEKIVVRYRIDGVLQDVAHVDIGLWKKIVSRIKLISGLKINITNQPQDGRFTIFLKEGDTDVRVSAIPTTWGESVVMRLLKPNAITVDFSALGFRPDAEKKLLKEIDKPHGMVLTTGPTGSGKTTTLYAILRRRNKPGVKVITLEDPIEYKLEGVNQSQIDRSKEYTFAGGLRSILRQDPDVLMVGEIRDLETADVAINAALTGHLLVSTLHTNDAAGALPRLIAMGVKPFLIAPALNALLGQRLVRKIHEACKEERALTPDELAFVKRVTADISPQAAEQAPPEGEWTFYKGKGCAECNQSGYNGRIGMYEILIMSEAIRGALSESISEYEVRKLAHEQGMLTMQQDGVLKALEGITTVEEILRVAGEGSL